MDNALLLYLKKLEQSMYAEFDDVLAAINNVQLRVDDIYFGNQISEWVEDLEAFGTSSTTYNDSTRMSKIIENSDACNNANIAKILLDWSISNNKLGIYCGSAIGNVSGVTWSSLANVNSVCSNSSAIKAVANNSLVFENFFGNASCRSSMFTYYSTTQSAITSSTSAMSFLNGKKQTKTLSYEGGSSVSASGKFFILGLNSEYMCKMEVYKGSSVIYSVYPQTHSEEGYVTVYKFADKVTMSPYYHSSYSFVYVDFS